MYRTIIVNYTKILKCCEKKLSLNINILYKTERYLKKHINCQNKNSNNMLIYVAYLHITNNEYDGVLL